MAAVARHRRWILALWVVLILGTGALAASVNSVLSGGGWFVQGSQSEAVASTLADSDLLGRADNGATLVVHSDSASVDDPEFARVFDEVVQRLEDSEPLKVQSQYGWGTVEGAARDTFVGDDRRTVVQSVGLGIDDGAARRELPKVQSDLEAEFGGQGVEAVLVSAAALWGDVNIVSQEDLFRAEVFVLPLILIILVLLFRSVASAAVALLVGVASIVMTLGVVSLIARQVEMSIFVENTASMLGLGVAVDYSLFLISRYLGELGRGLPKEEAITVALRTSGHTVVFSGLTVILTMSTLFFVDLNVIQSIAAGAVLVVAMAVLNASIFLPALLHLMGPRITWGSFGLRRATEDGEGRRWGSVAAAVMRRPVIWLVAVTAALLAVAWPALQLKTFSPDARILPDSSAVGQGFRTIQDQFGTGRTSPIEVVVESKDGGSLWEGEAASELNRLDSDLRSLPGVADAVSPAGIVDAAGLPAGAVAQAERLPDPVRQALANSSSADGRMAVLSLVPESAASTPQTRDLVTDVRDIAARAPGLSVAVGGETAEGMDSNELINDSLPRVIAMMLAVIYIALLLTFKSLLLPLKAVAINLLSVGATYGVLVMVFQKGWGAEALGLTHTGNLQNFVPVLLVALLLSLSTDYEVFLLGRVREEYLKTGDNVSSVVNGVRHTAPLISGAAILMVAVFGAFAFTGMVPIEQLGLGMAVGVLLDATVIRFLVVPAAMKLMGRANWWLPRPRPRRKGKHAATHQPQGETA